MAQLTKPCTVVFYAGSALVQAKWDSLGALGGPEISESIFMTTGARPMQQQMGWLRTPFWHGDAVK